MDHGTSGSGAVSIPVPLVSQQDDPLRSGFLSTEECESLFRQCVIFQEDQAEDIAITSSYRLAFVYSIQMVSLVSYRS
jgi:hypothetical protein